MLRWLSEYWRNVIQSVLTALGIVFLFIESYEVISDACLTSALVGQNCRI